MLRELYNRMIARPRAGTADVLEGPSGSIPIEYRKRVNARRYILRVNAVGNGGCVTIPRGGTLAEAKIFAKRNAGWLEDRLRRHLEIQKQAVDDGRIWYRGERVLPGVFDEGSPLIPALWLPKPATIQLPQNDHALRAKWSPDGGEGGRSLRNGAAAFDIRARIKLKLWQLAGRELPARVAELAAQQGLTVRRVSVRDQRSRWGSCSARRVISLNWRLVQAPEFVRDYIIVHELMHLREMNHSSRYWKLVEAAFPQMEEAERWLKRHAELLRITIG